uniref:Uncharacterized protein n=1 Tax=Mesocestoides corti TaxID=53468 RepID=A0A5K3FM98_MESCO
MEEASRDLSINRNRCAVLSESTTSGEWGLLKSPGRRKKPSDVNTGGGTVSPCAAVSQSCVERPRQPQSSVKPTNDTCPPNG